MKPSSDSPARLFHLHVNTPDVAALESWLDSLGVPLRQRFGILDGESVALAPGEDAPDGWRLRLQSHRVGAVDVTLAPGQRRRFDHLGVVTNAFDDVVVRVEATGWSVRDPDGRRPFVMTPWTFRVEVHRADSDVARSIGPREDARLERVEVLVPEDEAESVRSGLPTVFGELPALAVSGGDVERATLGGFTLAGDRVETTGPVALPE
ncbi:hypothetical protein [Halomarina rubra]|uniref:VOC domain-containing protein n=1 Tax=Halomarina rubra TaxID=2071873 RepID=A0ABD6AQZ4_9EURY|nr:hypothetical protein [Halomarina rubra]